MEQLTEVREQIHSVLKGGDILFIVPPFTSVESSVLGVHILQATAGEMGKKAEILYLNVLLASFIGIERSVYLSINPYRFIFSMIHERLFARAAYGLPPLGKTPGYCTDEAMSISGSTRHHRMFYESETFDLESYLELEEICTTFVDEAVSAIAPLNYNMIGCTSKMGQTNCSIAVLNGIKRIRPGVITLLGGSACEGEMAEGIASLRSSVDFIFSGESESSFRDFLKEHAMGNLPAGHIIQGKPQENMNDIPLPDHGSYFEQTQRFLDRHSAPFGISYETSRGCWWGNKRKCRFCGNKVSYRAKTAEKAIDDLMELNKRYPGRPVYMSDTIMPVSFDKEVFSKLKDNAEYPVIFYMQKVNPDIKTLMRLKAAKIEHITPGIEAISTELLDLMNKGCTARQNLLLLRNCKSVGIIVDWMLLWGFPGDKEEYYRETLRILPLIRHLQPPITFLHLFLARFSPYFEKADEFGISNIRPWAVHNMIFPEWADIDKLACWFAGDYPCEAHEHPLLIQNIAEQVFLWQKTWQTNHLEMAKLNDLYIILDNRNGKKRQDVLEFHEAREVMKSCRCNNTQYQEWALEKKMAVVVDSWYVPLITASPELLLQLEE